MAIISKLNIFKLLASTQYETDIIKTSNQNGSEIKDPFKYNCDTQDIDIIPMNELELTKTSDTGRTNVSNSSSLVNEEANLKIGASFTNYVLSSELVNTLKQETAASKMSSISNEISEINEHESKKIIDTTESQKLTILEKALDQKIADLIVTPKVFSLPDLLKAMDFEQESVIRKLNTRSLHDGTYMTPKQKIGNKTNNKYSLKSRYNFILTA